MKALTCFMSFAVLTAAVTGFGSTRCGYQAPNRVPNLNRPRNRIISGDQAVPHSWPWLLHLFRYTGPGPRDGSICSANLIRVSDTVEASDIAVTAAHCMPTGRRAILQRGAIGNIYVVAGVHDLVQRTGQEQQQYVTDLRVHQGFGRGRGDDVAVIKLERPVFFDDKVRPICLPQRFEPIPVGLRCMAAGWGRTRGADVGSTSTVLRQISSQIQSPQVCNDGWRWTFKEDQMICTTSEGNGGTCSGDSGGMLACQWEHNRPWILYGTTSFGNKTCLYPSQPNIFARIGNYVDFIAESARAMSSLI